MSASTDQPKIAFPESEIAVCAAAALGDAGVMVAMRSVLPHHLFFADSQMRAVWYAALVLQNEGATIDRAGIASVMRETPAAAYEDASKAIMAIHAEGPKAYAVHQRRASRLLSGERSLFDQVDGASTMAKIAEADPMVPAAPRHAKRIQEAYIKRRVVAAVGHMSSRISGGQMAIHDIVDGLMRVATGVTKEGAGAQTYTATVVGDEVAADQRSLATEACAGAEVTTGYGDVDKILSTMRPGGTYILAARPGNGKTTFAIGTALHVAKRMPILFFSLEIERKDLMRKIVAAYHQVTFNDVSRCSDAQWDAWIKAIPFLDNIRIADLAEVTAANVRAVVSREVAGPNPIKLVIIDYLQLMDGRDASQEEYAAVTYNSRQLKIISMTSKIPIMALSQMSRDIEKGSITAKREPRLSDLRSSGSIEQDANAVIFLHNVKTEKDERGEVRHIKVKVEKNRFGPMDHAWLDFRPAASCFHPGVEPQNTDDEEAGSTDQQRRLGSALGTTARPRTPSRQTQGAERASIY